MDWINIHVSALLSHEFLGSSPIERATWLCLLRYCVTQENGGLIEKCCVWKDRKWQQICGVTIKEVKSDSGLWVWEQDGEHKGLRVKFYPVEKEKLVQQNRSAGAVGGQAKTQAKTQASQVNGTKGGRPKNPSENRNENPTEGKGREGNRKGKEEGASLPFASEEFRKTWDQWEQHRREKKEPITPVARAMQLKKCEAIGEARAIAMLEHSAAGSFQGLYEPRANGSGNGHSNGETLHAHEKATKALVVPDGFDGWLRETYPDAHENFKTAPRTTQDALVSDYRKAMK